MLTSKWVLGNKGIEDAFALRRKVFIEEQGVSEAEEFDMLDERALHLILYEDEKCVATGRLFFYHGEYHMGRIAVLKEQRGKKYGDLLVRMLLIRAFNEGAESVGIDAQTYVVPFYKRFGFVAFGEEFLDCNIPHYKMSVTIETLCLESECGHDCANCIKS